jgi:hypothetical protein
VRSPADAAGLLSIEGLRRVLHAPLLCQNILREAVPCSEDCVADARLVIARNCCGDPVRSDDPTQRAARPKASPPKKVLAGALVRASEIRNFPSRCRDLSAMSRDRAKSHVRHGICSSWRHVLDSGGKYDDLEPERYDPYDVETAAARA